MDETRHEQTTLKISRQHGWPDDDGLEFPVDKGMVSLIEACWYNGAATLMSCEKTDLGTAYITFMDLACADKFLVGICANGDIYFDGNKVHPSDWQWTTYGPVGPTAYPTTTVNVYFPPELIGLLTERIKSENTNFPVPGKMITAVLPEAGEEIQRLFAEKPN